MFLFSFRDHVWVLQSLHLVVESGIHGQWNTNPANLQCCCSTKAETGFVPTSAQFFAASPSDTEVSCILDSFLYPEVARVNVLRSLSCSQSIRQRILRRTITLYLNLHLGIPRSWYTDLRDSPLTSIHHCVKLRFSNAQCCQALSVDPDFTVWLPI